MTPDAEIGMAVRLFHPGRDGWVVHLAVATRTGIVMGIISIGRSTVAQLRMNAASQLAARRQWMRLRLFP